MYFHDYTIATDGKILSKRIHDTAKLGVEAVDLFRRMLSEGGESFESPIPVRGFEDVSLRWTSHAPRTALATFSADGLSLTSSVLIYGWDKEDDDVVCEALNKLLRMIFGDAAGEIDLATADRPLIVSAVLVRSIHPRLPLVAEMETLLAAAFFDRFNVEFLR